MKPFELTVDNLQVVDDLQKGLFKIIKKELALDDIEDGDLINIGDEEKPVSDGEIISVLWNNDRQNYYVK